MSELQKFSKGYLEKFHEPRLISGYSGKVCTDACFMMLEEIPSEDYRVTIKGYNEVLNLDDIENENDFYVDYTNNYIYFHKSKLGKTITVDDYYGIGLNFIGASRIIVRSNVTEDVIQTLEDLIEQAKLCLEAITTLGGATEVIEQLKEDTETGRKVDEQLQGTIKSGKATIQAIKDTGNKSFIVNKTDWTSTTNGYKYTLTHNLQSIDLHVSMIDLTDNMAYPSQYKIINVNTIEVYAMEQIKANIVISAKYYNGLGDNVGDNIVQEVVDARGGMASLGDKIRDMDSQLTTEIDNVNSYLEDIPKFYAKKTEVNDLATSKAEKVDLNETNKNVTKNATDIAAQSARIDTFTSLASGSTTGDAELIDGRIGFDGIVNNNIGTAIREQVSMLNDESIYQFDNVIGERSKNAYSPNTATLIERYSTGCSLTSNSVKVVGSTLGNQIVNIVVPVSKNKTYKFKYSSSTDISVKGVKLATSIPDTWSNTGFVELDEIHTTSNTYIIIYFQLTTNISSTIYFSLREKIEETICQEIDSLRQSLVLRKSRNLYKPLELESGLIGNDGNVSAIDDYSVTGFIPIQEGQTIYFSRYTVPVNVYQIAEYDINGIFLNRTSAYVTSYTATSNVAYIRVGMLTSNFSLAFQIEYDAITNYQAYFEPFYVPKSNYISVSKDGTQDYITVSDAVYNANDGDIIIVYPGIYEDEQIEAWGKTVHIIGFDKKKTIIKNNLDEYATPPIEIASGSLKNLTVIAETGGNTSGSHAYAVHVEDDVMYNNSLVFENCCFKATLGATVGMGMRGLCDVEFNNCEFINEGYTAGVGTSGYALYFHDTVDTSSTGVENVTIKNCLLVGKHTSGVVVRIDSNGLDNVSVNMKWMHNILDNEYFTTTYLSLHNKSGVSNTDWKGLKGYTNDRTSFGNNANELNYTS